ncbi:MAG: DUF4157 domain-containing protein [Kofleriaceae bacterium]
MAQPAADEHIAAAPAVDLSRVSASAGERPASPGAPPLDGTLLVDHAPAAGQLTKSEFFTQLRQQIIVAAEAELAGTDWTVENCPWLEYWFDYYERRSARDTEAALLRYAPGARDAMDANGYFTPAIERVREAIQRWRTTGEIDAPPIAMPAVEETLASLGPGQPLDSATRSRFEGAMGIDLSATRVHADAIGARAASDESARAFAIGSHVAFASGEYRPGTLEGDALLAHELVHTSQQATARSSQAPSDAMESDANAASAGIMARLLGLLVPKPQIGRGGLSLQRCLEHKGTSKGYKDKGPNDTYLAAEPALIDRNGEKTAVVGQTVRFRVASEIQGVVPSVPVWRAFLMLDENGNESDHKAKQKKWDRGFPVYFDRAGLWFVGMEVKTAGEHFNLWREVRVFDSAKLAKEQATTLSPTDYPVFRSNVAYHGLTTFGVQKDQTASGLFDLNTGIPHSYITSNAPSNPMEVTDKPTEFTVVPHPDAVTFQWWVEFDNPSRHPTHFFAGGPINKRGTGKTQSITFDRADQYALICEQFDARGNALPKAIYSQSVLLGNDWKAAKKWQSYIASVDKLIDGLEPSSRKQIPGVYVSKISGESLPLAVWTGTKKGSPNSHVVLDLMFGIGPKSFSGSSLKGAIDDYVDWAEDHYPEGNLLLRGSVAGDRDRPVHTDGKTTAQTIAHYLGLGSVGLTLIGFGLLLFPPTSGAGFAVLGGAAALAAGSSGASIYNRIREGEKDPLGYAIDVLSLATSVLQGAAAFKTAVGVIKTGQTAEQLIVSAAGRKFVAWTETGLVTASGVLISGEAILALNQLADSNLSEGEKADRIAGLLFQIITQAGMIKLQASNLAAVTAAVNARAVTALELRVLAQLDQSAIQTLGKIPDTQIGQVARQVLDDPAAAARALSAGNVASADDLAKAMHGPPPSSVDLPTTTPDVPTTTPAPDTTASPDVGTPPADLTSQPSPAKPAAKPAKPAKVKPPKPGEPGFQLRTAAEELAMSQGMKPAPDGYHWRTIDVDGQKVPVIARSGRRGGNPRPKLRWNHATGDFETISDQWDSFLYSEFGGKKPPCFPPETVVKTPQGDRRIDELAIGDTVYSFDPDQQRVIPSMISVVHRNWTRRLATVHCADATVAATRMHPFWVEGGSWRSLRSLWPGMQLRALDGSLPPVESVVVSDCTTATFNLEIEGTHSYFVGAKGILVHNGPPTESAWAVRVPEWERIYRVIETKIVNGQKVEVVIYAGKTNQTLGERFKGHLKEKPDWKAKAESDRLRIELEVEGNWTPFETAVWEKHTIEKYKKLNPELENLANPIGEKSFDKFHDLHNPCP